MFKIDSLIKNMKSISLRIVFCIALFHFSSCLYAQSTLDRSHIVLTAGLNTNCAYDLELSYHYMLYKYLGVGSGIGYFQQWYNDHLPHGDITNGQWSSWTISESDAKIGKLYFRPNVLLCTPALLKFDKYEFFLQAESGVQLLIPYTGLYIDYVNSTTYDKKTKFKSTNKGNYCFWNFKSSINMKVRDMSIAFGYGISNLDIYSSRRYIYIEGVSLGEYYPSKKLTQCLYLNIAHSF